MNKEIGISDPLQVLDNLKVMNSGIVPIQVEEYQLRIYKLQNLMKEGEVAGIFINAGTNLEYFTGIKWSATERMVGAFLTSEGRLSYILPKFELGSFEARVLISGNFYFWEEHECPYTTMSEIFLTIDDSRNKIFAIDPSSPYFLVDGLKKAYGTDNFISGEHLISSCRAVKSKNEIAIMQCANHMTLEVQKSVASILYEGITVNEVEEFINKAHKRVGALGFSFCIVLFGEDTSYPHGVKDPKALAEGDVVLIDTGCTVHGYQSDITRCYVFGEPTHKQLQIWKHEKQAQQVAFNAAKLGSKCSDVDDAVRDFLSKNGYGPKYLLPGVPHRTGHGIGMDIHESPYLVGNDKTVIKEGMCFSNEPMIVIPGEFGIRHEDHFYMTESGPKWFTEPMGNIIEPFRET